jgi:hypothetical protein
MKPQTFSALAVLVLIFAGISFVLVPTARVAYASTTTLGMIYSITGWLVPDAAHFNAGIPVLIFCLLGMAFVAMMGRIVGLERNTPTLALLGLLIGSMIGLLSLGNSTSGNFTPFAVPIMAGADLALYVWMGGD